MRWFSWLNWWWVKFIIIDNNNDDCIKLSKRQMRALKDLLVAEGTQHTKVSRVDQIKWSRSENINGFFIIIIIIILLFLFLLQLASIQLTWTLSELTCPHRVGPPAFLASFALELVEKILIWATCHTNPAALNAVALYFLPVAVYMFNDQCASERECIYFGPK